MDKLTADDLREFKAEVHPVEVLGKQAYVRSLNLDGQEAIANRFADRDMESEARGPELRFMLACVLCDEYGDLLFDDFDEGAKVLSRLSSDQIIELLNNVDVINGNDIEAEKKPYAVTQ